eukprot:CAMPEP_0114229522 /NCGR_PEP_ID=MMETSP0058-20121206/2954_1 /TAXON_ID=36894 /ORGANISM="Pyramimonas parkeae, CCMP726" /LENGTH=249 /DNA_ID=CAMNT_0001340607 /DNA_START=97 /DNA_END=846 /DNA_ORIENTATION=+
MAAGSLVLKRARDDFDMTSYGITDVNTNTGSFDLRPQACTLVRGRGKRSRIVPDMYNWGKDVASLACAAVVSAESFEAQKLDAAISTQLSHHTSRVQLLREFGASPLSTNAMVDACGNLQPQWCVLADLNLLYRMHSHAHMQCPHLTSYHHLCRASKGDLFQQFVATYSDLVNSSPTTAALLEFVHDHTLANTPEVSLAVSTFEPHQWLRPWCHAYGLHCNSITLLRVQGFNAGATQPVCEVFVPKLEG